MIANGKQGNIVVPWNFEDVSRLALNRALKETETASCICVVHVAAPLAGPDNGLLYAAAEQRQCRALERRFRMQVDDHELAKKVRFSVVYGYVGPEIVRFAERCGAELIVMASREKKQISRLFFGSSTEQVVRLAHCPVLALDVRPDTNTEHTRFGPSSQPAVV